MAEQRQELRKAGLKVTLPRLKILEILENSKDRHLSAEDIYRELLDSGEDIGLATVYRVLTQFEAADLVIRHNFEGGHSVFELDSGDHHDHMVCIETGDVIEFVDEEIEKIQHDIARKHNYEIVDHNLVLYVRPLKSGDDDN
jgi:Fur family ferric uptake transcriptional regulator